MAENLGVLWETVATKTKKRAQENCQTSATSEEKRSYRDFSKVFLKEGTCKVLVQGVNPAKTAPKLERTVTKIHEQRKKNICRIDWKKGKIDADRVHGRLDEGGERERETEVCFIKDRKDNLLIHTSEKARKGRTKRRRRRIRAHHDR